MSVQLRSLETINRIQVKSAYAIIMIDPEGDVIVFTDEEFDKDELNFVLANALEDLK